MCNAVVNALNSGGGIESSLCQIKYTDWELTESVNMSVSVINTISALATMSCIFIETETISDSDSDCVIMLGCG